MKTSHMTIPQIRRQHLLKLAAGDALPESWRKRMVRKLHTEELSDDDLADMLAACYGKIRELYPEGRMIDDRKG